MKFWDNADALWSARGIEIETIKLINFILVMLRKPVLRSRESIRLFEFHIRRSKRELDQSLGDFGDTVRRRMFYNWRISQGKRSIGNRAHVPAFQHLSTRTDLLLTKRCLMKRRNINTKSVRAILGPAGIKNNVALTG